MIPTIAQREMTQVPLAAWCGYNPIVQELNFQMYCFDDFGVLCINHLGIMRVFGIWTHLFSEVCMQYGASLLFWLFNLYLTQSRVGKLEQSKISCQLIPNHQAWLYALFPTIVFLSASSQFLRQQHLCDICIYIMNY